MEFKVGQRYRIKNNNLDNGDIIEIVDIKDNCFGHKVFYKTIRGRYKGSKSLFNANSVWATYLKPVSESIVIYRNGSETIAIDKTTGEKAVAKCHPDDEYNLHLGATIALSRLINTNYNLVLEVKRAAKVGEYVKIVNASNVQTTNGKPDYKNGDILKIIEISHGYARYKEGRADHSKERILCQTEYVVLEGYKPPEVEEFEPYLISNGNNYGIIGKETPLKDAVGRPLRVGDTVELYRDGKLISEETPIVSDKNKAFVMGIEISCDKKGCISYGYRIIKKRDYTKIENGEKVRSIKYVKER